MFERLVPAGVAWAGGPTLDVDVILWCTGWRAALDHLAPLGLRGPGGGCEPGRPRGRAGDPGAVERADRGRVTMGAVRCPCGHPLPYDDCCGRVHDGAAAPTAEALMRSRYSAFATGDAEYLLHSWHPDTRPRTLSLDPAQTWERLDIVSTTGGGPLHQEGTVEFRAHYRHSSHTGVLHEHSRFGRVDGRWVYVDGVPR